MNKFEFTKTMEGFGLKESEHYQIDGHNYHHNDSYYVIVKGRTPYQLASLINKKYDNNKYKIRVNGGHESDSPNGNIYTYHIDTIEGLVAFLLETKDYFYKTEEYSLKMDEVLDSIYTSILKSVHPQVSMVDWISNSEKRQDEFSSSLNAENALDLKIRKKITEFDRALNPYCNKELELRNYNFIVRGYVEQDYNGFVLLDKETNIFFKNVKEKDSFIQYMKIPMTDPFEITVYHYYDKNGEELAFEKYDESGLSRIEYNLTNQTFGEHYGEKHTITTEDKKYVLQTLNDYITIASDIVSKNIGIQFEQEISPKVKKR